MFKKSKHYTKNKSFIIITVLLLLIFILLFLPSNHKNTGVSLGFFPAKTFMFSGEKSRALLLLNTRNKQTHALEVHIKYNPKYLEIIDADNAKDGIQIAPSNLLPLYSINQVNHSKGTIQLDSFSLDGPYSSNNKAAQLAIIDFKAKRIGISKVSIEFNNSKTGLDSDVVETKTNKGLLEHVDNLWVVVFPPPFVSYLILALLIIAILTPPLIYLVLYILHK